MNKAELIEVLSEGTAISKAAAGRTLELLIDSIVKAVAKGDSVTLTGFGTFKSVKRAARKGRNPKTGESIKIAASVAPKFTPGATFKGALNKKKPAKK